MHHKKKQIKTSAQIIQKHTFSYIPYTVIVTQTGNCTNTYSAQLYKNISHFGVVAMTSSKRTERCRKREEQLKSRTRIQKKNKKREREPGEKEEMESDPFGAR